ncbi:hypothetical protein KFE25_013543 [Diacronema lutheri]|mgnify:CR=1 FL=1|uniref:Uncharacterized protein n=1 Tax=Diacronema lutheri TaxID=2081491 RepID=A0A8J5XZK1_DIALT|nr:hypothetical protein KFE25_013543 [Diacronema lutheri]
MADRRAKTPKKDRAPKEDKAKRRSGKEEGKLREREPDADRAARREERAKRREEKERALREHNDAGAPVRFVDGNAATAPPPSAYSGGGGGMSAYSAWPLNEPDDRAFSQQLAALHGSLNGQVALKKRELVSTAQRVEANIERVQAARGAIERETRADSDGILERLRVHERSKVAVLQAELARLLATIRDVDDFTSEVLGAGLASSSEQRRAAAPRLPALADRAARLAAIPVDQPPLVRHDDLPREVEARRQILARHDALEGVLRVKDAMCWTLLREREAAGAPPLALPDAATAAAAGAQAQTAAAEEYGARAAADAVAAAAAAKAASEEELRSLALGYDEELSEWRSLAQEQAAQLQASADEVARLRAVNADLGARLAALQGALAVRAATLAPLPDRLAAAAPGPGGPVAAANDLQARLGEMQGMVAARAAASTSEGAPLTAHALQLQSMAVQSPVLAAVPAVAQLP